VDHFSSLSKSTVRINITLTVITGELVAFRTVHSLVQPLQQHWPFNLIHPGNRSLLYWIRDQSELDRHSTPVGSPTEQLSIADAVA